MEIETKKIGEIKSLTHKRNPFRDLTINNVSSGFISALLAMTGPPAIILEAAQIGQFTPQQTISWMFAVYFFGGLFSIIFPLIYKIPITGAHSITGVAFLVTITPNFSFSELIALIAILNATKSQIPLYGNRYSIPVCVSTQIKILPKNN